MLNFFLLFYENSVWNNIHHSMYLKTFPYTKDHKQIVP